MKRREFLGLFGGAIAAWPRVVSAQELGNGPTVAYLWHAGSAAEEEPYFSAIREGFSTLGYIDGRNIKLVHRFPNELPERFESMAAELVSMNVDVLMGGSTAAPYLGNSEDTDCFYVRQRSNWIRPGSKSGKSGGKYYWANEFRTRDSGQALATPKRVSSRAVPCCISHKLKSPNNAYVCRGNGIRCNSARIAASDV